MPEEKEKEGVPPTIIETIQEMVKRGADEQTIIKTLIDLGVEPDKAKRLLLLGEADTFALLKSEISKITQQSVDRLKPDIARALEQKLEELEEKDKQIVAQAASDVKEGMRKDVVAFTSQLTEKEEEFKEGVKQDVQRFSELSERVKGRVNEMTQEIKQMQIDMDEMAARGVGMKHKIISIILIAAGLAFLAIDLYIFFAKFGQSLTVDSMVMLVIMALSGITMLFVGTMV